MRRLQGSRSHPQLKEVEMRKEVWRLGSGYSTCQISTMGRVRRVWIDHKGRNRTRLMTLSVRRDGYLRVPVSENGESGWVKVHQLVAGTFLGVCPPGREVNHRDGNKRNNAIDNFEYVTPEDNKKHAVRVRTIRRFYRAGKGENWLFKEFGRYGFSRAVIGRVVRRRGGKTKGGR